MRSARNIATWAAIPALLVGCSRLTPENSRKEAEQRWSQVRGNMKLQVARDHLEAGRLSEAEMQLREVLALDPKCAQAHILAARVSLERGELAAARGSLNAAVELGGETGEIAYLLGILSEWSGDHKTALACFRRSMERDGPSPPCIVAQAEALVAFGQAEEALELIQRHRSDFAGNQALCSLAGDIQTMLGRYAEAAAAYREMALLVPSDEQAQMQFGAALARCGRHAEAIRVLEPLCKTHRDMPWPVSLALGRSYLELDNPKAAHALFQQVCQNNPPGPEAWIWLARVDLQQNDLDGARRAAAKACEAAAVDPSALLLFAHICIRQKDYEPARAALESCLQADASQWLAHYLLGQVLEVSGRPADATFHYRMAVESDPSQKHARQLLAQAAPASTK